MLPVKLVAGLEFIFVVSVPFNFLNDDPQYILGLQLYICEDDRLSTEYRSTTIPTKLYSLQGN